MDQGKYSKSIINLYNVSVSETKKKSTKELVKAVNELIVNGNEENVDVDP